MNRWLAFCLAIAACGKSSTAPATNSTARSVTLVNATSADMQVSAYDNACPAYWGMSWVVVAAGRTGCIRFDLANLGGDTILGLEAVSTAPGANNFQLTTADVGSVAGWSWSLFTSTPPAPAPLC